MFLTEEATPRWSKSNDADPTSYADFTQYLFPVLYNSVVLLAITVYQVRDPEAPDVGSWRAGGFAPMGNRVVTTYVRAAEVVPEGASIDLIDFRGTPLGLQVIVRDATGIASALNSVFYPIPLDSVARSWKQEYAENEKLKREYQLDNRE